MLRGQDIKAEIADIIFRTQENLANQNVSWERK